MPVRHSEWNACKCLPNSSLKTPQPVHLRDDTEYISDVSATTNFCVCFIVDFSFFFDRQRRNHTSTTPTHVNRQTDKKRAWGRPRPLHTVWKRYFFNLSWYVTKGLLRDYHVGASQNYCVSRLSSHRSDCGLTMQMSCLKDKPNIWALEIIIDLPIGFPINNIISLWAVSKGHTPEVVGCNLSIIRMLMFFFFRGLESTS